MKTICKDYTNLRVISKKNKLLFMPYLKAEMYDLESCFGNKIGLEFTQAYNK